MRPCSLIRLACVLFTLAPLAARYGEAQTTAVVRFPADKAVGVNPDTHLVHDLLNGTLDLAIANEPPESALLRQVQIAESPFLHRDGA